MMKRYSLFEIISLIILVLVTIVIVFSLSTVVLGGFPYLKEALQSEEVLFSIRLSLFTASISTMIGIILGIPCAYALVRIKFPGKKMIQSVIEMPLSLPNLVLGLCLLMLFSSEFGKFLKSIGFRVVFDTKGIIMAHLFVNLPFIIRLIRIGLLEIDQRLEFISRTLGASKRKSFFTVSLPLCKNAIFSAGILAFSRAMGEFGATLMLVGVTRMKTETLPASIYLNISVGNNGLAMASASIILFIALITQYGAERIQVIGNNYRLGRREKK